MVLPHALVAASPGVPALLLVAATGAVLAAVGAALLTVLLAEYLFEVGHRLLVRRTGLGAALRLEGPLRGLWSPLANALLRRRRAAGRAPEPGSRRERP